MSSVVSTAVAEKPGRSSQPAPSRRAEALAERLEQGARMLADFAATLTDAEWQTRLPKDGRKIGVIVHHVASQYMLEIKVALIVVAGQPVKGLTNADVDAVNAAHAKEFDTRDESAGARAARAEQRGRRGDDPCVERRRPRSRGAGVAVRRRAAHVPDGARRPRRPAQLSPPRDHSRGVEEVSKGGVRPRSDPAAQLPSISCRNEITCKIRTSGTRNVGTSVSGN